MNTNIHTSTSDSHTWRRLFNPKELNQLLSGGSDDGSSAMDVEDLRRHVRYSGGYTEDSTTVKLFWKVRAGRGGGAAAVCWVRFGVQSTSLARS